MAGVSATGAIHERPFDLGLVIFFGISLTYGFLFALACAGPTAVKSVTGEPGKFIVMLEGRNLILEYEGEAARFGFSTTRYVVAANAEEAEGIAIQQLHDDAKLNETLLNRPEDPPRYSVTHHIEVEAFDATSKSDLGYIFYRDRDTR